MGRARESGHGGWRGAGQVCQETSPDVEISGQAANRHGYETDMDIQLKTDFHAGSYWSKIVVLDEYNPGNIYPILQCWISVLIRTFDLYFMQLRRYKLIR